MNKTSSIIKATPDHLDDLLPLFNGYRVFYRQESDLLAAKAFLKERLSKQDTIIHLAYLDKKAVGFTQLFHSFSSVSMQPMFILNDLYVDKKYRNQGIGVALLNQAKQYCRKQDYKGLVLQTESTNPAQKLYESLGWKKDKDLHYFWYCD